MNINLDAAQQEDFIGMIEAEFDRTYDTAASCIRNYNDDNGALWALNRLDTCLAVLESAGVSIDAYLDDIEALITWCSGDIFFKSRLYNRFDFSDT